MVDRCGTAAGTALLLALALALGACGQRMTWSKEGVTADELKRDQKACLAEANSYGFLTGGGADTMGAMAGSSAVDTRQQGDIYRLCMAKRGYSQSPAASKGQPAPAD